MTTVLVPFAGARVPTDAAPDPTFTLGTLIGLLVVGLLLVGGVVALVLVLFRRDRNMRQNRPGSGPADRDGPVP